MLVAMLPSQVGDYWPFITKTLEDSLPPVASGTAYDLNQIMYSMMVGLMQGWVVMDKEQANKGIVITTINRDHSGVATLIIYSAIILENTAANDWFSGYDTLVKFAHSKGCSKIGAYVKDKKILALLKEQDFETESVFAYKDI